MLGKRKRTTQISDLPKGILKNILTLHRQIKWGPIHEEMKQVLTHEWFYNPEPDDAFLIYHAVWRNKRCGSEIERTYYRGCDYQTVRDAPIPESVLNKDLTESLSIITLKKCYKANLYFNRRAIFIHHENDLLNRQVTVIIEQI